MSTEAPRWASSFTSCSVSYYTASRRTIHCLLGEIELKLRRWQHIRDKNFIERAARYILMFLFIGL